MDPNYQYGRWLSSPSPDEEVVISGMSGRLPESNNIHEFRDHLFNKEEMVSGDGRRWKLDHHEIPQRTAKIHNIDKYDAGYFGVHYRQADIMDPMMRLLMETAIEAIMDAGVNPKDLEGSRTGVFVSTSWSDMEVNTCCNVTDPQNFAMTGYLRSLISHRVSYFLKLKGPACNIDTACSSSLNAFDVAFKAIRSGQCDNAIVGGTNLLLHPGISLQFYRLGVLSSDGTCRVFDENASGYVRGEAVVSVFLQKAKDSKRIYAHIINTKVNGDGFKEQGITFPSPQAQKALMTEIYNESGVHPSDLSFLEAHGTGTQVGDPQEVEAIDCALAQKRDKQLLVGSVKSSIGHTEPASGVCSLIKILLALETGLIAPNINLKKIKNGMTGFEEGRMKVVTELTELKEDDAIIGLNNFGFGGNNAHTILRRNKNKKVNREPNDDVPRLVCVGGRSMEAVQNLLADINTNGLDEDYIALLHQLFKNNSHNYFRGYTILSTRGPLKTSFKWISSILPLYIFFGQFSKNFKPLGLHLLQFPVCRDTMARIDKILLKKDSKPIEDILKTPVEHHQTILGSICIQIALVDMFKSLDIFPTAIYADSYAKLISAYYYGVITLEETVSAAVKISQLDFESDLHFQTEMKKIDKLRGDSLNAESLIKLSKRATVLNISDSHLNNKDLVLVNGSEVRLLETLGRLFEDGHNLQVHKLYPKVQFPVSRGTPMISPSIQWDHDKNWYTFKFSEFTSSDAEQKEYSVSYLYEEFKFVAGHVIDGRNLFPATQYLLLVWQTFAQSRRLLVDDLPVVFRDCRFVRALTMPANGFLALLVTIQRGTGYFEILEKNSLVVCGKISICSDTNGMFTKLDEVPLDEDPTKVIERDEIYRELYLRGYNYSGAFKGIEKCNGNATSALIRWENNWCSFMDKMLQMQILSTDTRLLFVPIGIKKLIIDPAKQVEMASNFGDKEVLFPAYSYKSAGIIKSGGVEIQGLQAKSIAKRKPKLLPVLEKHVFVPNRTALNLPEAVRVNTQIILENTGDINFKAVEIFDDYTNSDEQPLLPLVSAALDDLPLITPNLIISSKDEFEEMPGVTVEVVTLTPESKLLLIVGSKLLERLNTVKQLFTSLKENGFILSRERVDFVPTGSISDINILTEFKTPNEKIFLLQRNVQLKTNVIQVSSNDFGWLSHLKTSIVKDDKIVLYAKNKNPEGLLGMVNCLRREPNGDKVKCVFIMDDAPEFDFDSQLYSEQINKNLAVNVYKNETWGTYRHLQLEEYKEIESEHCYANVISRGDISSLRWCEGPLSPDNPPKSKNQVLVAPYYCAINFKDIMVASGRVSVETLTMDRSKQECLIGFEFCGRDMNGRRVGGMNDCGSMASYVTCDNDCLWEIPDSISLEEAATITTVYATVLYSLLMVGDMKPGSSILIHSGTGGIGIAALNVCLYYNCDVYVTVGTQEKRDYLKKHYPQIPDSHIGNSRDISFEEMIKTQTKCKGVNFVLNSLTDDKLKASIRCLARGGCFIEIGKFDLANDTSLELLFMEKQASYHGIMLDQIFLNSRSTLITIMKMMEAGIKAGYVKPLPRVVFEKKDLEASYRYMMTGKHIGKVLVKLRDEEPEKVSLVPRETFMALPRYYCDPHCTYVIIGGLGGIGLELADWLFLRGARKILLVSRSGIQNGYQTQRIKMWNSYGVNIQVSTQDVTTKQGCTALLEEASKLGPLDAIFNLAVVLKDALFDDQTEESFVASLAPKAQATIYLDQITRELCPKLRSFVVFSSVSCGRGNAGQTNYGMANSVMERICEKRKQDGFAALAVQWGAVGEVGLVAKMQKVNKELVIGGTLQQKVSNCFECLDRFLNQDYPVVSSMVVAEKHNKSYGLVSAVDAVAQVLGIKDLKTVSQHSTLAELGMDSMMGTEIIQLLEKDFEIYITPKDMRSLTLAKLTEMEAERKISNDEKGAVKVEQGANLLMRSIPEKNKTYEKVVTLNKNGNGISVFLFPGVDGSLHHFGGFLKELEGNVMAIQYDYDNPEDTIQEMAHNLIPHIQNNSSKERLLFLIAYSYGAAVALETANILENQGYLIKIILIEGAPAYLTSSAQDMLPHATEEEFQTAVIYKILSFLLPVDVLLANHEKFLKCQCLQERINLGLTLIPSEVVSEKKLDPQGAVTMYKRFKSIISYSFCHKIKSDVYLFKAKCPMINEEEDYQLSKICENLVKVTTVEGDHETMIDQPELVKNINEIMCK